MTRLEITQSGRGGSILYREGAHTLTFGWEFGGEGAVALLFGPTAAEWDAAAPWAPGRQRAVYEFVASDVLRQQVPGGTYTVDLATGIIEVIGGRRGDRDVRQSPAAQSPVVRQPVPERDPREALHDHLSIDVRLAAAEQLHRDEPSFDMEDVLAREIRNLHRPDDGLARALRLAERHDSDRVRQAEYVAELPTGVAGYELTSDQARYEHSRDRTWARSRLQRNLFEQGRLYQLGPALLDTRIPRVLQIEDGSELLVQRWAPPAGLAPDGRTFVRIGGNAEGDALLVVAELDGRNAYTLPIDAARMRYGSWDEITPSWVLHHFEWVRDDGGSYRLVERSGFPAAVQ